MSDGYGISAAQSTAYLPHDFHPPLRHTCRMSSPIEILNDRIAQRLEALGMTERDASIKATGKPDALRYIRTRNAMPSADRLDLIANALQTSPDWLLARSSVPPKMPDLPPVLGSADADGAITLKRINLGFAMGDGSNLDDYIEEGTVEFDPNLLRAISQSPPHRLLVAHGVGDSMQPTLLDSDMLVIDTLQTRLNMTDRIWAIGLFGAGAVKRLRPAAGGMVEVISDNPMHEKQIVSAQDVRIIGRVVWSGRRH
ncbi:S24 family peptidase [Sphingobium fuliginis]|uniref:LexA family transcriptional regulator n=1 Tax=Sphingobium fuliginis (strain ATCC 27551) TaxID=336203 RepID=UPI0037C9A867